MQNNEYVTITITRNDENKRIRNNEVIIFYEFSIRTK